MSTVTGMGFRNLIGRAFARQCVTNELRRKFMEFRIPELQGISYIEKIIQSYWYSWALCRFVWNLTTSKASVYPAGRLRHRGLQGVDR